MKYTPQNLVFLINDIPYDEEIKIFNQTPFEFDDCTVDVSGHVYGTFDYERGDYFLPPSSDQKGQVGDLYEVVIGYDDETKFLCGDEIFEIEKLLKW